MPHHNNKVLVSELTVYPIKSCAGVDLQTAGFDRSGIINDRSWSIINSDNRVLTQREFPRMALIKPCFQNGSLLLSATGMRSVAVYSPEHVEETEVKVWGDFCQAVIQNKETNEWLSEYLKTDVRLVKMHVAERRTIGKQGKSYTDNTVGFQDCYPILLISEESLHSLNSELDSPLKMNRFRPNIVVRGCQAYEEDSWRQIIIGKLKVDIVEPCARCVVTTIEQETAKKGAEPLKTLSRTRLKGNKTLFGQNAINLNLENVSVGDEVKVLQ